MDLRKPKRFATFSLGLGKKKKKHTESISTSTFGLSSSDAGNEVMCDTLTLISGRPSIKWRIENKFKFTKLNAFAELFLGPLKSVVKSDQTYKSTCFCFEGPMTCKGHLMHAL